MRLHNRTAITFLQEFAAQRKASVWEQLAQIGEKCVISRKDWEFLLSQIQSKASICVHFHPYRRGKDGRSVIEGLLSHGKYLNQFETQISNGSLTAFPGGQRDRWEQEMFGGRMGSPELSPGLRPKYGALDLLRHASGPCPRFGSCYLVLSPTLNPFATVCYGDSYVQPQAKAPIAEMAEVLASLFSESFDRAYALGEVGLLPPDLFDTILKRMAIPYVERVNGPTVANLNHYLEAQIHSEVLLEEDVATLVADACFRGTEYEAWFQQIAKTYQIELLWHPGFQLTLSDIPARFRGPQLPNVAKTIANGPAISAHDLALAEQRMQESPGCFPAEVNLQQLKFLWHALVQFGQPVSS